MPLSKQKIDWNVLQHPVQRQNSQHIIKIVWGIIEGDAILRSSLVSWYTTIFNQTPSRHGWVQHTGGPTGETIVTSAQNTDRQGIVVFTILLFHSALSSAGVFHFVHEQCASLSGRLNAEMCQFFF